MSRESRGIGACQSQRNDASWRLIREQHQAEQFFLMRRGNRLPQSKKRFHSTFVALRRGRMEEEPTKRLSNMIQKTSGEPRSDVQASAFPKPAYDPKKSLQSVSQISGKQPFYGIGRQESRWPQPLCGRVACLHLSANDSRVTVSNLRFDGELVSLLTRTFQQQKSCICLKSTLV